MLQKELAKRLRARYDTKMDGNGWLEVSSDGVPLCRIKYNGQFLSNADQNLSDEYRSKIADIQDEISTVREYVGLYEHAPQMKADGVSDYRQLAAFGDAVLAATYSEKNGFMFCTWKQTLPWSNKASVLRGAIKLSKNPVLCHRGHHDLAMLRTFWQKDRLDHFQQYDVFRSLSIDVLDPDVPWAKGGVRGSCSKCTAFFNDVPVEHLTI